MQPTTVEYPNETKASDAGHYALVNGLHMYYEIHGSGSPLVLLHGALSTIETSFGKVLPLLARTRQVIAIEQQAHGRTKDIDQPLTIEQMAADTVALLEQIGIKQADFFAYSMGIDVALQIATMRPEVVRKLVLAGGARFSAEGFYPEFLASLGETKPEDLEGTIFQQEYARVAPNPQDWPQLVAKISDLDKTFTGWPVEVIQSIKAPTQILIGDSDLVRPEHAIEMFRLFGGGMAGDLVALPKAQLGILPGTTHLTLVDRADLLMPMIVPFLDTPL